MPSIITAWLTLCGALVLSAASVASEHGKSEDAEMTLSGETLPMESVRDARFRFIDLDGDGYITRQEIGEDDGVLRSQFTSLDTDGDERLSEAEYVLFGRSQ